MFAAVVDAMDQAMGQVLDTVDDEGLRENTIVLFMSDNGGATYASGGANNAPLRGGKGETFEGGIRVVALMRWPAKIKAGTSSENIVSVMDVFPTLAGATAIEPGTTRRLDGRNLWPALATGRTGSPRSKTLLCGRDDRPGTLMTTAFDDEWKLVQRIVQKQLTTEVSNSLFRISQDPYEHKNVAAEYPERVAEFSQAIVDWRALHPIGGTPRGIAPPPGWRAPRDWADYPVPIAELRDEPLLAWRPQRCVPCSIASTESRVASSTTATPRPKARPALIAARRRPGDTRPKPFQAIIPARRDREATPWTARLGFDLRFAQR